VFLSTARPRCRFGVRLVNPAKHVLYGYRNRQPSIGAKYLQPKLQSRIVWGSRYPARHEFILVSKSVKGLRREHSYVTSLCTPFQKIGIESAVGKAEEIHFVTDDRF
jgi:hypothetical protein